MQSSSPAAPQSTHDNVLFRVFLEFHSRAYVTVCCYQVSAALAAARLPLLDDPVSADFPRFKTVKSLPARSSDKDASGGTIAVHAPLLEWDARSRCTGHILW